MEDVHYGQTFIDGTAETYRHHVEEAGLIKRFFRLERDLKVGSRMPGTT